MSDLISREALKKAYFNAINETSIGEVSIIDIIDNAPAVDTTEQEENAYNEGYAHGLETKRPQGEWLDIYSSHIAYECSNCHIQMPIYNYYFCPNCGAKMKEKGANDES